MAQAYTPGLHVARSTRYRVSRLLPIPGDVLVAEGAQVTADKVVAQTFRPGEVTPLNLANLLSVSPGDVAPALIKKPGDSVAAGEVIARSRRFFGLLTSEVRSPVTGTLETVSAVTGQSIIRGPQIPIEVSAYLAGQVVEVLPGSGVVIESVVTLVQGIFGIGGEVHGVLKQVCSKPADLLTPERLTKEHTGAVVLGGGRVTADALARAKSLGVRAVVCGGIDDRDLRDFLGYDLGVAMTGSETTGVTLVITEGFGDIAMATKTFDVLSVRCGAQAAVNGATQIRAGVIRPEIVIPWDAASVQSAPVPVELHQLEVGARVRVIRDPHFGELGTVKEMPSQPEVLESGSRARVLRIALASGALVSVPRANVEFAEI